ncbi:MAG: hypothetical protein PVG50_07695, partial [Thiohalophilus sp.]
MTMEELRRKVRYATRFPATRYALLALPVAALLLLGTWLLLWRPEAVRHAELQASVNETRQSLISLMRLQELRDDYDNTLQAVESVETKLERVIPLSEYVKRLNSLAQQHRVQIINESRKTGKLQGEYLPIYQELVLEASYESMRRFLSGLSSLPTWTVV